MNDRFNKKELENKLQGFQPGKDYSVLPGGENGKQIYDIHSEDLKKSLWGDRIPVWCKVEVYDNENEHYRGRFEGYEDGYHSVQVWWRGKESNPDHLKIGGDSHPDFDHFNRETKKFFEDAVDWQKNDPGLSAVTRTIGNVFEDYKKLSVTFDPPNDYQTCQCNLAIKRTCPDDRNRCLKCGGIFRDINRENIRHACWDCGKFEVSDERVENGNVRCNECDNKQASYLQEKSKEDEQKNQQISDLKEKNQTLNQQLEVERQAKQKAEKDLTESKTKQEQARIELIQLREELAQVEQELVQVQEQLKKQIEKSPESKTEQLIEKLGKSNQDLVAHQKLVQKPKLNHQEIAEIKNQLDNSRQVLVAAAAHTQSVEKKSPQFQAEIKPVKVQEESQSKSFALLIWLGGLVLFLGSFLAIGYWLGKRKK